MARSLNRNVNQVAELGDEIAKSARSAGMAGKAYQEWKYIMESCGADANALGDITRQMTSKLKENSDVFDKLGVETKTASGEFRSLENIFNDTIGALQSESNETQRLVLAQEVFGEGATKIASVLAMSNTELRHAQREANVFGAVMSDNALKASEAFMNMKHTMSSAFQGLKNSLAEGLMPVITRIINMIAVAIAYINAFVRAIFGLSQVFTGTNSGLNKASKTASSINSSIGGAAKSAKELKRQLMGFDELNVLQAEEQDSGGGGGGASVGAIDLGDTQDFGFGLTDAQLDKLEQFQKKMDKLKEKLPVWTTIGAMIAGIGLIVAGAIAGNIPLIAIGAGLVGIGVAVGASKGEDGQSVFDRFSKHVENLKGRLKDVIDAIGDFFANVGSNIADGYNNVISIIKEFFGNIWDNISEFFKNLYQKIKPYLEIIIEPIKSFIDTVIGTFAAAWDLIKVVWDFVAPYYEAIWDAIKIGAKTLWNNVVAVFEVAWAAIKLVWGVVVEYFEKIWEDIKVIYSFVVDVFSSLFSNAWRAVERIWGVAIGFFENIWNTIRNSLIIVKDLILGDFQGAWDALKDMISGWGKWLGDLLSAVVITIASLGEFIVDTLIAAWDAVKGALLNLWDFVKGIWDKITDFFSTVATVIADAFTGTFKGIVNGALSLIEGRVNGFIRLLNGAVNIINKIPGVSISKISEVSIPKLAEGGIATRSTVANIGEAGREAILPLDRNTSWMDILAERINGAGPEKIVLMLDGRALGEASIKSINQITRQTGTLKLELA